MEEKKLTHWQKYYYSHKEEIAKRSKEYNDRTFKEKYSDPKHRERMLNNCKKSYEKNKIPLLERKRKEYSENEELRKKILLKTRKYAKENKEAMNIAARKYRANNRVLANLRNRINKVVTKGFKSAATLELLGCSMEKFKIHLESQFQPGMTWDNYGKWHIDHIKPCAMFDLNIAEQQQICFHYTNLQPLWAEENGSKGSLFENQRYFKTKNKKNGNLHYPSVSQSGIDG